MAYSEQNVQDHRYPIGRFITPSETGKAQREVWTGQIERLPVELRNAVADLSDEQLDTPYREGGWSVRQVVHHMPDSHMNSYVRFRLALTEESPLIKPYDEAAWAELADARTAPISVSLALLEALHTRWMLLIRSLAEGEFARSFQHPALGSVTLGKALAVYAWHSKHHLAQITSLRSRRGW